MLKRSIIDCFEMLGKTLTNVANDKITLHGIKNKFKHIAKNLASYKTQCHLLMPGGVHVMPRKCPHRV